MSSGNEGMWEAPRNRMTESVFINRMLAYSAK